MRLLEKLAKAVRTPPKLFEKGAEKEALDAFGELAKELKAVEAPVLAELDLGEIQRLLRKAGSDRKTEGARAKERLEEIFESGQKVLEKAEDLRTQAEKARAIAHQLEIPGDAETGTVLRTIIEAYREENVTLEGRFKSAVELTRASGTIPIHHEIRPVPRVRSPWGRFLSRVPGGPNELSAITRSHLAEIHPEAIGILTSSEFLEEGKRSPGDQEKAESTEEPEVEEASDA